jgi:hypothetical protein
MDKTVSQFSDFNTNLSAISNSTMASFGLQKQFKESLEKHFPTIQDHREKWGESVDLFNKDISKVYKHLEEYFKLSTNQIKGFVENNQQYFSSINEIDNVVKTFVASAEVDKEKTLLIFEELINLKKEVQESKIQEGLRDQAILESLQSLNTVLTKIEAKTSSNE